MRQWRIFIGVDEVDISPSEAFIFSFKCIKNILLYFGSSRYPLIKINNDSYRGDKSTVIHDAIKIIKSVVITIGHARFGQDKRFLEIF